LAGSPKILPSPRISKAIDTSAVEAALRRVLAAPRPPADQEYFHRLPDLARFCQIRSPLDLTILATLHWRATRGEAAFFSTGRPLPGSPCRRAVQGAVARLARGGWLERQRGVRIRVPKGHGAGLRASFLAPLREGEGGAAEALAARLCLFLALTDAPWTQRGIRDGLGVAEALATELWRLVSRMEILPAAAEGACFSQRRRGAPNRSFSPPTWCPESCAINDRLEERSINERKEPPMQSPIDDFSLKVRKILPLREAEAVEATLAKLFQQGTLGHTWESFQRHGFDIYLARGANVTRLAGYLFMALSRRKAEDPTPALTGRLEALEKEEDRRTARARDAHDRVQQEAAAREAADEVVREIEEVYPGFRGWGLAQQAELMMALGADPREALRHHDRALFLARHST
jgi:hypothetical protein